MMSHLEILLNGHSRKILYWANLIRLKQKKLLRL